jgi:hypothetical protein
MCVTNQLAAGKLIFEFEEQRLDLHFFEIREHTFCDEQEASRLVRPDLLQPFRLKH